MEQATLPVREAGDRYATDYYLAADGAAPRKMREEAYRRAREGRVSFLHEHKWMEKCRADGCEVVAPKPERGQA